EVVTMVEHRREILDMLSRGQINADEAERLLAALENPTPSAGGVTTKQPKYLRVLVDGIDDRRDGVPMKVNVRIPMQLLRAGVRLASLIPPQVRSQVNEAMQEKGVQFDLNQIKPENLEELIDQLGDISVDVNEKDMN